MHAWYSHHSLRFRCFSSFLLLSLHDPLADPLFVFSPLPSMPMLRFIMSLFFTFVRHNLYEFPRSELSVNIGLLSSLYSSLHLSFNYPRSLCILPVTSVSLFVPRRPERLPYLVLIPLSLHHDEILGIPYGYYLIIYLFPL